MLPNEGSFEYYPIPAKDMRNTVVGLAILLCISAIPTVIAGGGHGDHSFTGLQISRPQIENTVLTDQDGNPHSMHSELADATVVAFIFTRCHDVCPAITQNLKSAKDQLGNEDVAFISISVDPEYDTPERLKAYTELHNVDWPHLTSDDNETISGVWDEFILQVNYTYIDSHDENGMSDHGNMDNDSHDLDHPDSVTVVMPDGNSTEYDVVPNAWDQFTASIFQNEWTTNISESSFGHMITEINGDIAPSDNSWGWELHTWNMSNSAWESSPVGIDSLDPGNFAFAPNTTDDSSIPVPDMNNESFTIVQSNGTSDTAIISHYNAWHQSLAALDNFDAPNGYYGHYMATIDNVTAPSDVSWWWQLHYWNSTSESWEESEVGMDSLADKMHIAWAPNSTMDHMIPAPMNMMGDSNHSEHEHEDEGAEYSTKHTTLTFILDDNWKPKVTWSGYSWDVDGFVDDVLMVIEGSDDFDDHHDGGIPGFTFVLASLAIGLAIIAAGRNE
jgi:protein SCO1/2